MNMKEITTLQANVHNGGSTYQKKKKIMEEVNF